MPQACLVYRPLMPQLTPLSLSPQLSLSRRINSRSNYSISLKPRFLKHRFSCTLDSENRVSANDNSQVIEFSNGSVLNESSAELKNGDGDGNERLPIMVFLVGVFARLKNGFEKVLYSEWFSWWPYWRLEKGLERLIAEADANPGNAAKQSALLAELNKQRSLCICY